MARSKKRQHNILLDIVIDLFYIKDREAKDLNDSITLLSILLSNNEITKEGSMR
jgi:hypothetical protein